MYMLLQHNITEFAAIGGSRSLGIEEITSDTDLIIVANNPDYQLRMKGGFNTLYKSPTDFYEMLTLSSRNYIHIFQFLYPERFMTDNEFTDWIIKNRDELFAENKKVLYDDTCNFLKNTQQNLDAYYKVAAKKFLMLLLMGKQLNNILLVSQQKIASKRPIICVIYYLKSGISKYHMKM